MLVTAVSEFGLKKEKQVEFIKGERDENAIELVQDIDEIIPDIVDVGISIAGINRDV